MQRPGLVPTRDRPVTLHVRVEGPVTRMATREPALDAICATEATARALIDSRTRRTGVDTGGTVVVDDGAVVVVTGT